MADTTPPVTAEQPAEPLVYRPLSGLAIAGLACSAVYAAAVLMSLAFGLVLGKPFFLAGWMLVLPIAGVVLSLLARRAIANSEGTRAGESLATWGLWLGVIAGLGYSSYTFFTGLAIRQQADRFLTEKGPAGREFESGFFPHLIAADRASVNAAYLMTRPLSTRLGADPAREETMAMHERPESDRDVRGPLGYFRESDLVRLLRQKSDPPARVEPAGVRDWGYDKQGYYVERNYRIITPEASFEMPITVRSTDRPGEGSEGGRKWQVEWRPDFGLPPRRLTPLGEKMMAQRLSAAAFARNWLVQMYQAGSPQNWLKRTHETEAFDAYLATRPPAERAELRRRAVEIADRLPRFVYAASIGQSAAAALPGGPVAALPLPLHPQKDHALFLPGLSDFLDGRSFPSTAAMIGDKKGDAQIRRVARTLWHSSQEPRLAMPIKLEERDAILATWEEKDGRHRVTFALDFPIIISGNTPPMVRAGVASRLTVEADANFNADGAADAPGSWRVVEWVWDRSVLLPSAGPGGPGGPGGPS